MAPIRMVRTRSGFRPAAALICSVAVAAVCPGQSADSGYTFVQDLRPRYMMDYDDTVVWGHLDAAGNLVPDPGEAVNGAGGFGLTTARQFVYLTRPTKPNEVVYEFRSGKLIPGTIDIVAHFVPTVGAKVIDFKHYHYGQDARRIYNLPGRFVKRTKDNDRAKQK
ncbi:MAG TPA: hypothetical protein VFA18_24915 [Gemmataceae bacterium]|nr:hypothetical protein [Gemmataceae bacterium]